MAALKIIAVKGRRKMFDRLQSFSGKPVCRALPENTIYPEKTAPTITLSI